LCGQSDQRWIGETRTISPRLQKRLRYLFLAPLMKRYMKNTMSELQLSRFHNMQTKRIQPKLPFKKYIKFLHHSVYKRHGGCFAVKGGRYWYHLYGSPGRA
jgi:hypothetical protein